MITRTGKFVRAVLISTGAACAPHLTTLAAASSRSEAALQWGAMLVIGFILALLGGLLVAMGILADRLAEDERGT